MGKELMNLVLPRLSKRLDRQLRRFQAGQLSEAQFSRKFELLLQQLYHWLANRGIPEVEAVIAVHAAVLILSGPGLRAEAAEQELPLEVIEFEAVRSAAEDIAQNYGCPYDRALRRISLLVALGPGTFAPVGGVAFRVGEIEVFGQLAKYPGGA